MVHNNCNDSPSWNALLACWSVENSGQWKPWLIDHLRLSWTLSPASLINDRPWFITWSMMVALPLLWATSHILTPLSLYSPSTLSWSSYSSPSFRKYYFAFSDWLLCSVLTLNKTNPKSALFYYVHVMKKSTPGYDWDWNKLFLIISMICYSKNFIFSAFKLLFLR